MTSKTSKQNVIRNGRSLLGIYQIRADVESPPKSENVRMRQKCCSQKHCSYMYGQLTTGTPARLWCDIQWQRPFGVLPSGMLDIQETTLLSLTSNCISRSSWTELNRLPDLQPNKKKEEFNHHFVPINAHQAVDGHNPFEWELNAALFAQYDWPLLSVQGIVRLWAHVWL